jgi:16S rRNA (guanine527-N7)-methyltransferase
MEELLRYFPNITDKQRAQFAQLFELYTHWNSQINVISRKDLDELYERHVLHSLAIAKFISFKSGSQILDIGTGGGFPAIPLAIIFPEIYITASDSIAKKIKVVTEVSAALGLENITPTWTRAEQLESKFDFVVNRAVAPLTELYTWAGKLISSKHKNDMQNGMISLKGGDLKEEMNALKQEIRGIQIHQKPISDYFQSPFFETKSIIYSFRP